MRHETVFGLYSDDIRFTLLDPCLSHAAVGPKEQKLVTGFDAEVGSTFAFARLCAIRLLGLQVPVVFSCLTTSVLLSLQGLPTNLVHALRGHLTEDSARLSRYFDGVRKGEQRQLETTGVGRRDVTHMMRDLTVQVNFFIDVSASTSLCALDVMY